MSEIKNKEVLKIEEKKELKKKLNDNYARNKSIRKKFIHEIENFDVIEINETNYFVPRSKNHYHLIEKDGGLSINAFKRSEIIMNEEESIHIFHKDKMIYEKSNEYKVLKFTGASNIRTYSSVICEEVETVSNERIFKLSNDVELETGPSINDLLLIKLDLEKGELGFNNKVSGDDEQAFEKHKIIDVTTGVEILKLDDEDIYIFGEKRKKSKTLRFRVNYNLKNVAKITENKSMILYSIEFENAGSGATINSLVKVDKTNKTCSIEKCGVMSKFVSVEDIDGETQGYFVASNSGFVYSNNKQTDFYSSCWGGIEKLLVFSKKNTKKEGNHIFIPREKKFENTKISILAENIEGAGGDSTVLFYNDGNKLIKRSIFATTVKYGFDVVCCKDELIKEISDAQIEFLSNYLVLDGRGKITNHQKCLYDEKNELLLLLTDNEHYKYITDKTYKYRDYTNEIQFYKDNLFNKPSYIFDISNNDFKTFKSYVADSNKTNRFCDIVSIMTRLPKEELDKISIVHKLSNKK